MPDPSSRTQRPSPPMRTYAIDLSTIASNHAPESSSTGADLSPPSCTRTRSFAVSSTPVASTHLSSAVPTLNAYSALPSSRAACAAAGMRPRASESWSTSSATSSASPVSSSSSAAPLLARSDDRAVPADPDDSDVDVAQAPKAPRPTAHRLVSAVILNSFCTTFTTTDDMPTKSRILRGWPPRAGDSVAPCLGQHLRNWPNGARSLWRRRSCRPTSPTYLPRSI